MLKAVTAVALLGAAGPGPVVLELTLVLPAADTERSRDIATGVRFGVEEAVHTARLVGAEVVLTVDRDARGDVVLGGLDRTTCDALSREAARRPFIYIALGCGGRASDSSWTFHLEPDGGAESAGAVLWHPALERYGAGQLNARFVERFGRPMSAAAWSGWMAVKIALEAALKARASDPRALRKVLTAPMRFDGHKGAPLSFDSGHRLAQPLYRDGDTPAEIRP